jgi:hypothetical protein
MKNFINIFLNLWIAYYILNLIQFRYHLIFHQRSTKLYDNFNNLNFMALDEKLNYTQIP